MLSPQQFIDGAFVLIDKPKSWTSFDVIGKIRGPLYRFTGNKKLKIGHAGTLDPMATGLLLVAVGKFTKQIAALQDLDKEYTGVIRLGGITPSYDAETPVTETFDFSQITDQQIKIAASEFNGEMEQIPPVYSSIKMGGVRAYKLARENEEVVMKPRRVVIHDFEIRKIDLPDIDFRVACSKGTYIRSIAHDLGQILGCGGYLSQLTRTRIGHYKIEDAVSVDTFLKSVTV